jgi:hypothetical protein
MRGGAVDTKPRRAVVAADVRMVYQRRLEELVTRAADAFRVCTARDWNVLHSAFQRSLRVSYCSTHFHLFWRL